MGARKEQKHVKLVDLDIQKELAGGQERNRLHMATMNGVWIGAIPHHRDGTELSQEELKDNLCLRYGLMPQDIPATFNGFGKMLLIKYALLCEKGWTCSGAAR